MKQSVNSGQWESCEGRGRGRGRGSLEVAGRADVGLGQLLLLALLGLLVPAAQHVVEVVRRRVGGAVEPKNVADLRVLDVHSGHVEGWPCTYKHSQPTSTPVIRGSTISATMGMLTELR